MTTFLFWNLYKKPLQEIVANLARRHEIDVFMLAECSISPDTLLNALNQPDALEYHHVSSPGCTKIELFTRFPYEFIPTMHDESRLTIRHLKLPGLTDILLAVTHLTSKRNQSSLSQGFECTRPADDIRAMEQEIGHSRTILVGDLNMNPFEGGIVAARGFNGVMCRNIVARRGTRTIQSVEYPFFYNPMWSLLGDASPGPPGTYYGNVSEQVGYFWNMFDQVLIRPDLLECFNNDDLKILDSVGDISLLSRNGLPNKSISDHLPILFKLNL